MLHLGPIDATYRDIYSSYELEQQGKFERNSSRGLSALTDNIFCQRSKKKEIEEEKKEEEENRRERNT